MFRLLRVKPPNGWGSVVWELAIVTAGVLIALAVQQWAEGRRARSHAMAAIGMIGDEAEVHYQYAVEWRRVAPCLYRQIDILSGRLVESRDTIDPAPVYSEPGFDFYVIRMPNRVYPLDAWQAAISDGVTTHLQRGIRGSIISLYSRAEQMNDSNELNNRDYPALFGLSRRLPVDAGSRLEFLRILDELRGRVEFMNLLAGQIINDTDRAGFRLDRSALARRTEASGTLRFCRQHKLPTSPLSAAMRGVAD